MRKKLGRNTLLSAEQENDLVRRITRYTSTGFPLTSSLIRYQVYKYTEINDVQTKFNNEKQQANRGWLKMFFKRHPELLEKKSRQMNAVHTQNINQTVLTNYFIRLGEAMDRLGLKDNPQRVFTMDEIEFTMPRQQSVADDPENAENVTVVACVNAIGDAIPPMLLFENQYVKSEFGDDLPYDTTIRVAEKGSMSTELFISFMEHLKKFKPPGKILLTFEGVSKHLDFRIVDEAEKYDIELLCLPNTVTHELQPLRRSVYRSLHYHWDQQLTDYRHGHPERKRTDSCFNSIFSNVWSLCMTRFNITNGFMSTGMYPYNPTAISKYASAFEANSGETDESYDSEV